MALNPRSNIKIRHNQRCKECKIKVEELLRKIYGKVERNYRVDLASNLDSFQNTQYYEVLNNIFELLQNHRDQKEFVRAKKLPRVDFFVSKPGFIVEFDETQHFSKPREITLMHYPADIAFGFDRTKWIRRCQEINEKDKRPPYRDEQRAWYDTLRDFAPLVLGLLPTKRLFSKDLVWCDLKSDSDRDVKTFREYLEARK